MWTAFAELFKCWSNVYCPFEQAKIIFLLEDNVIILFSYGKSNQLIQCPNNWLHQPLKIQLNLIKF